MFHADVTYELITEGPATLLKYECKTIGHNWVVRTMMPLVAVFNKYLLDKFMLNLKEVAEKK